MENSANMKSKLILVISVLSSTCKGDGSTSRPPSTEILSDNFGFAFRLKRRLFLSILTY